MFYIVNYILLFTCFYHNLYAISVSDTDIRLLLIIYRHGDRTPVQIYPTDPYNATVWDKYGGIGQLTQKGMIQHREFGKYLRNLYSGYLSQFYNAMEVKARTTDYDRTLMSTYSLLSGLYPPSDFQVFDPQLNWQPIAVHTTEIPSDNLFHPGLCQRLEDLKAQVLQTDEFKQIEAANQPLLDLIKLKSGFAKSVTIEDLWFIGDALYVEKQHGLKLPDWAEENYPKILELLDIGFYFDYRTTELARLTAGGVLNDMRNNMVNRVKNATLRDQVYLYGAHDTFIAALTKLLNISTYINQPPYASAIILELRRSKLNASDHFVQVFLKNNTPSDPISMRQMTVYGCDQLCPLNQFLDITNDKIVVNFNAECGKPTIKEIVLTNLTIIITTSGLIAFVIFMVFSLIINYRNTKFGYQKKLEPHESL